MVYRFHKRQGLPSRSASKKGGCEALGHSRGGFSTKLHLVCDGLGNPLTAILTPGQQHERTVCTELLASVRVWTSAGGGRPRSRPKLVVKKLVQVLVFDCAYWRIADDSCSAITLRRRRDEWINSGVMDTLQEMVFEAYGRVIGLKLDDVVVDGCITKAPCGGERAGKS